jgi:hypothetical protein
MSDGNVLILDAYSLDTILTIKAENSLEGLLLPYHLSINHPSWVFVGHSNGIIRGHEVLPTLANTDKSQIE